MTNTPTYDQLRHRARRQGLRVVTKGGGYMLIDPGNNTVVAGAWPNAYSLNADEIADILGNED